MVFVKNGIFTSNSIILIFLCFSVSNLSEDIEMIESDSEDDVETDITIQYLNNIVEKIKQNIARENSGKKLCLILKHFY